MGIVPSEPVDGVTLPPVFIGGRKSYEAAFSPPFLKDSA